MVSVHFYFAYFPISTFCSLKDFTIKIFDLHDVLDEKLAKSILLTHDKVNSRISVSLQFPGPICLKASISFKGQRISNGDFDIIVLSSKFQYYYLFVIKHFGNHLRSFRQRHNTGSQKYCS